MSGFDRLERDLAVWFEDTAVPKMPDYVDDIVREAVRGRQRPRWSFVGRWLPARMAGLSLPSAPVPWRPVAALIILALLLAALVAFVGNQRRVPSPFGLAENGLLAIARDGDMYLVDPVSRIRQPLVSGPDVDSWPRFSLDGTRVAFLRGAPGRQSVVVANLDGVELAISEPFEEPDPDSVAWSPDRRWVAIGAVSNVGRSIYLVDASTGVSTELTDDYAGYEFYWQPPDGRRLLYSGRGGTGLRLVTVADGTVETVPIQHPSRLIHPQGWTSDGRSLIYQIEGSGGQTHIFDVETEGDRTLNVWFGHLSNDGTRIAGAHPATGRPCVVDVGGDRCAIVPNAPSVVGDVGSSIQWAPNDEWLVIGRSDEAGVVLVDLEGDRPPVTIPSDGTASFQRVSPP